MIFVENLHDNDNTVNNYINSLNNYLNEVKIDFTKIPSCDTDSEDYDLEDDESKTIIFNIFSPMNKNYKGVFIYSFLVKEDLVELKSDIESYKKREFYEILKTFYNSLKLSFDTKRSTFSRTKLGVAFLFETYEGECIPMFIDDTSIIFELKDNKDKNFLTKNYIEPFVERNIQVSTINFSNSNDYLCIVS